MKTNIQLWDTVALVGDFHLLTVELKDDHVCGQRIEIVTDDLILLGDIQMLADHFGTQNIMVEYEYERKFHSAVRITIKDITKGLE